MPTVFVKDDLRAAVEAATGGLVSVHYTQRGQPCFMRWIPKFNLEDLGADYGSGVHPAFVVDGAVKDGIWIGVYPAGIVRNGELLSLPGVAPSVGHAYVQFINAARAAGPGFHVMTNAEWAAIALWCAKNGFQPRGNSDYGRAHNAPWETGTRVDGGTPGVPAMINITITGSGPVSWRHDNTPAGIADLVGNIWEITPGMRLVDGEIQVLANNDAASAAVFDDSAAWRAIRAADGELVAPGSANTLKYDSLAASGGNFQIDDTVDFRTGPSGSDTNTGGSNSMPFASITADAGITVPPIMRALCLAPGSLSLNGVVWTRNYGKRFILRGGGAFTSGGGLGAIDLNLAGPSAHYAGARLAKV